MGENGKIYIHKFPVYGVFHHSTFLSGQNVAAAGEILVEHGLIRLVTNGSGHYTPSLSLVRENVITELNNRGYFFNHNSIDDIDFVDDW